MVGNTHHAVGQGDDKFCAAVPVNVAYDDILHVGGDPLGVNGSEHKESMGVLFEYLLRLRDDART